MIILINKHEDLIKLRLATGQVIRKEGEKKAKEGREAGGREGKRGKQKREKKEEVGRQRLERKNKTVCHHNCLHRKYQRLDSKRWKRNDGQITCQEIL